MTAPAKESNTTNLPPRPKPSWATAVSFLATLSAIGAAALHAIGMVSHSTYLIFWGVDSGLFPKSVDWILLHGYYSVLDRALAISTAFFQIFDGWRSCLLFLFAWFLTAFYWWIWSFPTQNRPIPAWMLRFPHSFRKFIVRAFFSLAILTALPGVLFILSALMVVPVAIGEFAGKHFANEEMRDYENGCEKARHICVRLQKDGRTLAMGFVLESSPTHTAIWDVESQRTMTLARDGVDVQTERRPKY